MPDESSSLSSTSSSSEGSLYSDSSYVSGSSQSSSSNSYSSSSSTSSSGGSGSGDDTPHHPRINKAIARELNKCEQIARVALKAEYSSALEAREITPAMMNAQLQAIQNARTLAGNTTAATVTKQARTKAETAARNDLIACLDELRSAAKQKYSRTDRNHLSNYFIGVTIDGNRADLEQYGEQIIDRAEVDQLPGITAAKITRARECLEAYSATNVDQGGAQADASELRRQLKLDLRAITNLRIATQHAADAEWPHKNKNNAPIRREFQLPIRSSFLK